MLRLAGFKSDAVQEIITEQMVWGFQRRFGIECRGKPEKEKVKDFLYGAQHINTDRGISENSMQGTVRRLENMYKNLADRDHECTFDVFGEFLWMNLSYISESSSVRQIENLTGSCQYFGCFGGGYTYSFIPSGIGTVYEIPCTGISQRLPCICFRL